MYITLAHNNITSMMVKTIAGLNQNPLVWGFGGKDYSMLDLTILFSNNMTLMSNMTCTFLNQEISP